MSHKPKVAKLDGMAKLPHPTVPKEAYIEPLIKEKKSFTKSDMVQLLFICRNSDPKKFTFFTTRPGLLCKNETDKYFSMNSSGFY